MPMCPPPFIGYEFPTGNPNGEVIRNGIPFPWSVGVMPKLTESWDPIPGGFELKEPNFGTIILQSLQNNARKAAEAAGVEDWESKIKYILKR